MFYIGDAVDGPDFLYNVSDGGHLFGVPQNNASTYSDSGTSGSGTNLISWQTCRDRATDIIQRGGTNYIWLRFESCPPFASDFSTTAWNIARWFYYIEGRMGWQERTQFNWVHNKHALKITLAPIWLREFMSISLFTLMLRVGRKCTEGTSLEDNLHRDPFCVDTLSAIHRFLQGNNYCTLPHPSSYTSGWHFNFYNKRWEDICKMLVKHDDIATVANRLWRESGSPTSRAGKYWRAAKREILGDIVYGLSSAGTGRA